MADCQSAAGEAPAPHVIRGVNYTEGWSSFRTFPSFIVSIAVLATGCANCCRAAGRATRDFWALQDIGFEVEKGEMLGLVGPNGCGKSTLLQIVSGILQPTDGTRGDARAHRRAAGTGRGLQSGIHRAARTSTSTAKSWG